MKNLSLVIWMAMGLDVSPVETVLDQIQLSTVVGVVFFKRFFDRNDRSFTGR